MFPVRLSVLSLDVAACICLHIAYQTQYCIWFCHRRADVIRSDKPDSNLNYRDFTAFRNMVYSQTTIHCKCVRHSSGTVPALITNRCSRALKYTHPHLFSHRHQHNENDGIADDTHGKENSGLLGKKVPYFKHKNVLPRCFFWESSLLASLIHCIVAHVACQFSRGGMNLRSLSCV